MTGRKQPPPPDRPPGPDDYVGVCPVCRIEWTCSLSEVGWYRHDDGTLTPCLECPSTHERHYLIKMKPLKETP